MKLFDTETKSKREFTPIDPEHVTMYVCGPTVYSYAHIGNARPAVVFDVLARVLRSQFPKLTYARNITDIEDKINAAAAKEGVDISVISQRYTKAYHRDLEALGVQPPDVEPKVTDHVDEITHMIQQLIDLGFAYEAESHVLFEVDKFADYGKLSKRDPDELIAGSRVEVAPYKRSAGDFVLWKPSTDDQPGWPSPWGRGRPGWHIECSAMSAKHLGENIDIHGGGHDLIFPHHENERAQSTCAHGARFVNYWLHNGFVNVEKEKMSKSIGNVLLIKDLLTQAPGEAIRYALLASHYRAPLDWSDDALKQARASLDRLYGCLRDLAEVPAADGDHRPAAFVNAMLDDLNIPKALSEMFALAKAANSSVDLEVKARAKAALLQCGAWLGLLEQDPLAWFQQNADEDIDIALVENLIAQRQHAKAAKDWTTADEIRDQLLAMKIVLEDSADTTRWKVEK